MNENKPKTKTKVGAFEVTGWDNEKDGKKWVSYQLQKSWKQDEEWKQSKMTLNASDLPKVVLALQKAFEQHYEKNED